MRDAVRERRLLYAPPTGAPKRRPQAGRLAPQAVQSIDAAPCGPSASTGPWTPRARRRRRRRAGRLLARVAPPRGQVAVPVRPPPPNSALGAPSRTRGPFMPLPAPSPRAGELAHRQARPLHNLLADERAALGRPTAAPHLTSPTATPRRPHVCQQTASPCRRPVRPSARGAVPVHDGALRCRDTTKREHELQRRSTPTTLRVSSQPPLLVPNYPTATPIVK